MTWVPHEEATPELIAMADQQFAKGMENLAKMAARAMQHKQETPECQDNLCIGEHAAMIMQQLTSEDKEMALVVAVQVLAATGLVVLGKLGEEQIDGDS